jgi:NAD(P)-dependent dehydrogenase (short-subunit alcohol dehydrogenase family)
MTSTAANVKDKVILITGGAQGIGGAAAQLCAQRGAEVIITDIKDETGEALASTLQAQGHSARHEPQQRRLPGAARPYHRHPFAALNGEIQGRQHGRLTVAHPCPVEPHGGRRRRRLRWSDGATR